MSSITNSKDWLMKIRIEDHGSYKGKHQGFTAIDEDSFDGGVDGVGSGTTALEAIQDLMDTIECPSCGEIALEPMDFRLDGNGKDFMVYECSKCHIEADY